MLGLEILRWILLASCLRGVECFQLPRPPWRQMSSSRFYDEPTTSMTHRTWSARPANSNNNAPDVSSDDVDSWRSIVKKTILRYFEISHNPLSHHPDEIRALFHNQTVEYIDTAFYNMPLIDAHDICRHLQLSFSYNNKQIVDEWVLSHDNTFATDSHTSLLIKAFVLHHKENMAESQAMTLFHLTHDPSSSNSNCLTISKVFTVAEPPEPKPGSFGLQILKGASVLLNAFSNSDSEWIIPKQHSTPDFISHASQTSPLAVSVVEKYFEAWNQRQMQVAVSCFAANLTYYDLQYSYPIVGRNQMEQHLNTVAECLPRGFQFCIDDVVVQEEEKKKDSFHTKVGVQWHVENNGQLLPFTRGCSLYHLQPSERKTTSTTQSEVESYVIEFGMDIPEPAVIKTGLVQSLASQIRQEPVRILPLAVWIAYMYIVFLSNGILPGANALTLESRTWEEVRDLSLNFFLVAPILHLPFSPTVHPMLEGIFNLLLAWAAMFVGFLSDERDDKPNRFSFGIIVVGMQFLTSAFLLPYLGTRTSEAAITTSSSSRNILNVESREEQSNSFFMKIAEWKPLGLVLASIGSGAIFWSLWGRPEYGSISDRYQSLLQLLSIDRVGCSFLVDLVIFSLFQGWLIEDDLKRRGVMEVGKMDISLRIPELVGKFIPFYGLAFYFWNRPE